MKSSGGGTNIGCWAKARSCFVYYVGSCTMSGVGLFYWTLAETAFFLGLSFSGELLHCHGSGIDNPDIVKAITL